MPADRRHLTILCCDIVNSTHYAEVMDAEDFDSLLTIFYTTSKTVVEGHRGIFAHHTGDGFTAYFGSPRTQGRNALEAITCGRSVVAALDQQTFPRGTKVKVRIGIATGLVVLSTVNRQNNETDLFAVGAPVHLAARIQSVASPGTVGVDETSRALAHGSFEFTDLGTHVLKGFAEPVRVWQADTPKSVQFRFEERQERLSPFVGRDREIKALDECWRLAQEGRGQAVFISGEPGIGKSRLVFESLNSLAPQQAPLVFQCLEGHENDPLHPWINYMRHAAGVLPSQPMAERRQRVEGFFDRWFGNLDWLRSFVVSLVAQDNNALSVEGDSEPARKLDAFRAAIVDSMDASDREDARIVVVEDLHWIDPSSEQIVNSLIERAAGSRLLVICTSRTKPSVDPAPHRSLLPIEKLSSMQAIKLAGEIIGGASVADSVLAHVVEHSDGIPLYIEEMARTALSARSLRLPGGMAGQDGRRVEDGSLPIPDTLQGTLLARLDSLGESKELAQIASVIGREFELEVLGKLASLPGDALERQLAALVASGLVRPLRRAIETRYEFKHALIRDAAYNSLLRRDAVSLHASLARLYEEHYPDMRNSRPETLAQHLTISGRLVEAAALWLQAGTSAKEIGSTIEAMTRFNRCLQCLDASESAPETWRIRMRCQMERGAVINAHFGPVDQDAHRALDEAARLGEILQDSTSSIEALILLSIVKYNSGDFSAASQVANQLMDYGRQRGNERAAAIGMVSTGMCRFATGQFQDARSRLEEALTLLDRGDERAEAYEGLALAYLALTTHILGNSEKASQLCALAIKHARNRGASAHATALGNSQYLHCMRGDVEQVRRTSEELAQFAQQKGLLMWYHQAKFFLGWALTHDGDLRGLEMMEASMTRFREAREMVEQSFFYGVLAERYLAADMPEKALHNVEQGLALASEFDERFFEAPLLRLKAKCLLHASDTTAADEIARLQTRAEQLIREQGAVAWG